MRHESQPLIPIAEDNYLIMERDKLCSVRNASVFRFNANLQAVTCSVQFSKYEEVCQNEHARSITFANLNVINRDSSYCPKYTTGLGELCLKNTGSANEDIVPFVQKTTSIQQHPLVYSVPSDTVCGWALYENQTIHVYTFNRTGSCSSKLVSLTIEHNRVSTEGCLPGLFSCADGQCIYTLALNDGTADCSDGSDEDQATVCNLEGICTCRIHYYRCPNGACVLWDRVDDGVADCPHGEDELLSATTTPTEPKIREPSVFRDNITLFQCQESHRLIPTDWVNDTIPDCPGGYDEPMHTTYSYRSCSELSQIPCIPGHPKCLPFHSVYDNYGYLRYCRNGAHLAYCFHHSCPGLYKCPESYCVPAWKLCDDVIDCPDGEDEEMCSNGDVTLTCPGFLKCKGGRCVHPRQVCDGQNDCELQGDDEVVCDRAQCLGGSMVCRGTQSIDGNLYKAIVRSNSSPDSINITNGHSLVFLNISSNNLSVITDDSFGGLDNLRILDISNNNITIGTNAFRGLTLNIGKYNLGWQQDRHHKAKHIPMVDII